MNRVQTQTEDQTNVSMTMYYWQTDTFTNRQMPNATETRKMFRWKWNTCKHLLKGFATLRYHEHVTCVSKFSACKHSVDTFAKINHFDNVWTICSSAISHKPCHQKGLPDIKMKFPKDCIKTRQDSSLRTCDHKNSRQKQSSCTWFEHVPTCDSQKSLPHVSVNVSNELSCKFLQEYSPDKKYKSNFSPGLLSEEVDVQKRLHKRAHSRKFPHTNSQAWFLCGFGFKWFSSMRFSPNKHFDNYQSVFNLQGFLSNNLSRWIQHERGLSIKCSFYTCFTWKMKMSSQQGALKINRASEIIFHENIGPKRCSQNMSPNHQISKDCFLQTFDLKSNECVFFMFFRRSHEIFIFSKTCLQLFHKTFPLKPHAQKQTQFSKQP